MIFIPYNNCNTENIKLRLFYGLQVGNSAEVLYYKTNKGMKRGAKVSKDSRSIKFSDQHNEGITFEFRY